MTMQRTKIDFAEAAIEDLTDRLLRMRWPNEIPGSGWDYGTNLSYMRKLVDYRLHEYDWRAEERRLNRLSHFKADVDGLGIHFMHEEGKGPSPTPCSSCTGTLGPS